MKKIDWYLVGAVVLAAVICDVAFSPKARAHNPDTHQVDDLGEAKSKLYGSCCVGDDYQKLRTENWETTATGWRVFHKGRWLEVPKLAKVYNMDNPDGEAKVWIFGADGEEYVRCFMAGARS